MNNVLAKLESSENFNKVCKTLTDLINEELQFASTELYKEYLLTDDKSGFDLFQQIKLNGEIFRSNFEIIFKNLLNTIYFQTFNNDNIDSLLKRISNKKPAELFNNASIKKNSEILTQKNYVANEKLVEKYDGNTNIQTNNDLANSEVIQSVLKDLSKASPIENIEKPSKIDLRTDHRAQTENPKIQDNSFSKSPNAHDRTFTNLNQSSISNRPKQYNGLEKVDSEFSMISGTPSTFSRAERNIYKVDNQTPGPGDYNTNYNVSKPKSPNQSFSKSPRRAWIDDEVKKRDHSPGPIYTPNRHYVTSGLKKK